MTCPRPFALLIAGAISLFTVSVDLAESATKEKAIATVAQPRPPFLLEALVDFVDDALAAPVPVTAKHIDSMMQRLKELGVRRVSWAYYGDGHGGYLVPTSCTDENWKNLALTYRQLGNPLRVAVEAGHRHGLEVYAYYKPYETGPALILPKGSPECKKDGRIAQQGGSLGWVDPFVVKHSDLRIRHRDEGLLTDANRPRVRTIRLTKSDAAPTRVTGESIEIWTSANNYGYQKANVAPRFAQSVEKSPREVRDNQGRVLTRKGDPVRVLTLSGLDLHDKYILVTTSFSRGSGDFSNSGTALLTALDVKGQEIPGVFASGKTIWLSKMVDFRKGGLMYDHGYGAASVTLDEPNASGRRGFIAFTIGRNTFLPGALCETEPKVQEFWLSCLDEMIAAGVDGVDFREENHSTHTDVPNEYGYNPVILEQCKNVQGDLQQNIARIRGDAYTAFLRRCKQRLSASGKRMRYNLQLDYFRTAPPESRLLAYPANLTFQWQRWIGEGLMDQAVLRFYAFPFKAIFEDKIAREMITACKEHAIPMCVNRYLSAPDQLPTEAERVYRDGRFSGFIFYETAAYLKFDKSGGCAVSLPAVKKAATIVHERIEKEQR
jgi:uncharacterized lipoprotein YddW (UPF0748 family)